MIPSYNYFYEMRWNKKYIVEVRINICPIEMIIPNKFISDVIYLENFHL